MKNLGKKLAYLLRHDPEYKFKDGGWRETSDLIKNHGFTMKSLKEITETDEKNRYELSLDGRRIRARQGHSVNVNVDMQTKEPPEYLYHGTAKRFLGSILKDGIKKMNRLYVQLSADYDTAWNVGSRHGEPIVLKVNTAEMHKDGIEFKLSSNNVWCVDYVPKEYISYEYK